MTKRNSLCLVFALLFLTMGSSAWALDLTISSATVSPGATFDVTVAFNEDTSFQGGEVDIAYDSAVLTFNSGTPSSNHAFSNIGIVGGNIKVVVAGMSAAVAPDNVIGTLNFTMLDPVAVDSTPITFADVSTGFDGNSIAFTPVDGTVTVATDPQVTGIVGQNGTMTVDGADASGVKTFAADATPTYTIAPASGYRVATFKVDTVDTKASLTDVGDGTYTYTFGALPMGATRTIEVTFEIIPLPTVTTTVSAGGSVSTPDGTDTGTPGEKSFAVGSTPTYTVSIDDGFKVTSFKVDNVDAQLTETNTYTFAALGEGESHTVDVTFAAIVYPTVTKTVGTNGTMESATGTVVDGVEGQKKYDVNATPTYTVTPATGYKVDTFQVDGADAQLTDGTTYAFAALQEGAAHTISVTFKAIVYPAVTKTVGENGSMESATGTVDATDPNKKTYGIGETPIYTVSAATGYKVDTFQVDGADVVLTDGTYTFAALQEEATHTISVTFTAIVYPIITKTVGENGTMESATGTADPTDANKKTYEVNQEVVYTVTPTTGYEVDTFQVDGADAQLTNNTYTFPAMAEGETHTIAVTFKLSNNLPIADTGLTLDAAPGETSTGTLSGTDQDDPPDTPFSFAFEDGTTAPKLTAGLGIVTITDPAAGTYTYRADSGAVDGTTDSFTFVVTDAKGGKSEPATVTVNIVKPCTLEVKDLTLEVAPGATSMDNMLDVTYDCPDTLTYSVAADPAKGRVSAIDGATGKFTYKADGDATGTDTFTIQATDGKKTDTATVTVNFTSMYAATATATPMAGGTAMVDKMDVIEGESVTLTVTVNTGYRVDNVTLNGTAIMLTDNAYTASNVMADQTFAVTFKANSMPMVSVSPTTLTVMADEQATITVTASDADGDELTYSVSCTSATGMVVPNTGTIMGGSIDLTYSNTAEDTTDVMTVTVDDGNGGTAMATVTITIDPAVETSSADVNNDFEIVLQELMRIQQIYSVGVYYIDEDSIDGEVTIDGMTYHDGYSVNGGEQTGMAHSADYKNDDGELISDWKINLSEFLRITQIYNLGGYCVASEIGQDDEEGDNLIPRGGPGCP